ncbi:MAG: hypothetical protein JWM86_1558 [Thermoleophilia bacterium]|nr:hypothetical protein [Thermoleophilia bacterium]
MMVLPPVAGAHAGQATGGGLIDTFKSAMAGATGGAAGTSQTPPPGPRGDGSVGLFDGVLKKALISGALGVGMGFIPFLPGGPVLGGIVGALGGAAMGVFGNWMKMKQIKQENEAALAAMGVQADDPAVKQILQSGNVSQLIPLMTQQGATGAVQQGATGAVQQGTGATQQTPKQNIQLMTDPATGQSQLIDLTTGQVVQQDSSGTPSGQSAQQAGQLPQVVDPSASVGQSPAPKQGTIAVGSGATGTALNPNAAVNPGVAPALAGGGGAAGDAGRPTPPIGVNSADVSFIAPTQAGVGEAPTATAVAGVETLQVDAPLDRTQLAATLAKLEAQIAQIKAYLEEQERSEQLDKAAAR